MECVLGLLRWPKPSTRRLPHLLFPNVIICFVVAYWLPEGQPRTAPLATIPVTFFIHNPSARI
jgi:hypothetical protein